jgi:hypothetical protein
MQLKNLGLEGMSLLNIIHQLYLHIDNKTGLLIMLTSCRWRDVKLRAFENADHRTYVDLKVRIGSFLPSQAINFTWLIEHLSSLWLVLSLDSTLVIIFVDFMFSV